MSPEYLHNHPEFSDLIRIVAQEKGIDPALVEKDYWIMNCLYCLQKLNMTFQLKGGTSLSKGYQIINRFSEDIDIRIEPPKERQIRTGKNHNKAKDVRARKDFFDWVAKKISFDGIEKVERDTAFDNKRLTSAGIRLRTRLRPKEWRDLSLVSCWKPASTRCHLTAPKRSVHGCMTTPSPRRCRSSTTERRQSLAMTLAIPSSKNFRPFPRNSVSNRRQRSSRRLHAALLRPLQPAAPTGGAGVHWNGCLQST